MAARNGKQMLNGKCTTVHYHLYRVLTYRIFELYTAKQFSLYSNLKSL